MPGPDAGKPGDDIGKPRMLTGYSDGSVTGTGKSGSGSEHGDRGCFVRLLELFLRGCGSLKRLQQKNRDECTLYLISKPVMDKDSPREAGGRAIANVMMPLLVTLIRAARRPCAPA